MGAYGYEIVHTLIVDIEPDPKVKAAMNDINAGETSCRACAMFAVSFLLQTGSRSVSVLAAAQRLRVAATDKAEAEKILQVKRAEAEAETKYLSGVGVARQREVCGTTPSLSHSWLCVSGASAVCFWLFQAIVTGLRDSVLAFSNNVPGSTPKEVLDMVMLTQYFDTMRVCH